MVAFKDKPALRNWEDWYMQFVADVEIDTSETATEKASRIAKLEADPEAWFKYYFPAYCTAEPALFHKRATKRLLANNRWYEVRAWSRELAKSARSMMEVTYLALNGQIKNVLIVSNSNDNAERLLTPFRLQLEKNIRIKNDYGDQVVPGSWEAGEFNIKMGTSFRAIGAGQSPRGTRNESKRPDFILIDDIDTDEECRNPERIKTKWEWIEKALIPTVSISGNYRILFNGNIIAKNCCITKAMQKANHFDIVNIRDKNGNSSWPEKNSEAAIDDILSKISTRAAQQEYYNNPVSEGDVFKELTWGKVPDLSRFKYLVSYGDPAPSNKKTEAGSYKSNFLVGVLDGTFYIITGFLDKVTNAEYVDWYYHIHEYVRGKSQVYYFIENNTLQDPFYQQVFIPLFVAKGKEYKHFLSIAPDERKKPDKFSRIEGNLEPLNRQSRLIFNEKEKGNPHMQRLQEQFLLINPRLNSPADGPDCVEGAVFICNTKQAQFSLSDIKFGTKRKNKKRV